MPKKSGYNLKTAEKIYSYWGKSVIAYKLGVSFFGYDSYLRKKAVEKLNLKEGEVVVDLACGPGIMLNKLHRKVGDKGRIIAVDYVNEMIKQCMRVVKKNNWHNVALIKEDGAKLNLPENSVDAVISIIGLSAIPDHVSALKKCKIYLKHGGRLVVLDGKKFNSRYKFLNPLLKLLRWDKTYKDADILSDIKKVFGNIQVDEYLLGSTFIALAVKK